MITWYSGKQKINLIKTMKPTKKFIGMPLGLACGLTATLKALNIYVACY